MAARLEEAGIITTSALLPESLGTEGIRMGVQEMTRLGATTSTMGQVAHLFADAVASRRPSEAIASEAAAIRGSLGSIRFVFP